MEFTNKAGDNPATRRIIRTLGPFLINSGTDMVQFHLEKLDELPQLVTQVIHPSKPNPLIVFAATHQSHADITVILETVRRVRSLLPNMGTVYVPIATTLEKGTQNGISHTWHKEIAEPNFARHNIHPFYVITRNDIDKRGEKLPFSLAKAQQEEIRNITNEPNSTLFGLLEGTVQSGRHDKNGLVYGIQEVTTPLLKYATKYAREIGREVIIAPIGISKTNRLLSAEMIWLTGDSFKALMARLIRRRIVLAQATAGTPFILDHNLDPKDLNNLVMKTHVAPLIREEERGFYK